MIAKWWQSQRGKKSEREERSRSGIKIRERSIIEWTRERALLLREFTVKQPRSTDSPWHALYDGILFSLYLKKNLFYIFSSLFYFVFNSKSPTTINGLSFFINFLYFLPSTYHWNSSPEEYNHPSPAKKLKQKEFIKKHLGFILFIRKLIFFFGY